MTTPFSKQIQAARDTVIDHLIEAQINRHSGDSSCFHSSGSLAEVFRRGFKGFEQMTLQELIDEAQGSELDQDLPKEIQTLREAIAANRVLSTVYSGHLTIDGERIQLDFSAPVGATAAEVDSAFLGAVAQQAQLEFLAIGDAEIEGVSP